MPSPSCGVARQWAWEAQTCPCARGRGPSISHGNQLAAERAVCPARAKDPGIASDRPTGDPVKMCRQARRTRGVGQRVRGRGPETLHVARDVASLAAPGSPEPTSPASESHQVGGAFSRSSHHHLRNEEGNRERLHSQKSLFVLDGGREVYVCSNVAVR